MTTSLLTTHSTSIPTTNGNIRRIKCPVHHGKNLSVAVGYINGRAWAKCWSRDCASADILAALNLSNTPSIRWTLPPTPAPRSTTSAAPLPAVSHAQALDYLKGIKTHEGAAVFYQRNDGQSGKHWRNLDMRRNPGVTGDGWQVRRFNPNDPSAAVAIALTEGEKDAAQLSAAGLIAFTAPRGAQSLPGADFTELVALAKDTHLPILLIGDNDEVGRKAMRQVRRQLQPVGVPEPLPYPITGWKRTKNHSHLDVTDLTGRAPEKGSIADLPQPELHKLLGLLLQDLDERMVKPVRSRMMYREYWCPHPKRQQRAAGDDQNIMTFLPCGNTATCQKCCDWENFLHIQRCWRGEPAQMVVVSGFGGADSTIAETVGMAKVYRGRWQDRLRKTSAVDKYQENPTSERRKFLTALALGDDYRGQLTFFFSSQLSDKEVAKERRRAERAGLAFTVKDVVTREDIEDAAPKALTINMEGVGNTDKTNTWTSSHWPPWWEPDSTYAFSDPRELEDGEQFPPDAISEKDWKREYDQRWDCKKSLTDNLIQREEDAHFNAQLWMAPCVSLNLETLQAIGAGQNIEALILEIGDYQGPAALLRDTAAWLAGRREWRKSFVPVLDAAGGRA